MTQDVLLALGMFAAFGLGFVFIWKISDIVDHIRTNMPWIPDGRK